MEIMQVIDLKLYTHNSTYFIKTQEFFFKLKKILNENCDKHKNKHGTYPNAHHLMAAIKS